MGPSVRFDARRTSWPRASARGLDVGVGVHTAEVTSAGGLLEGRGVERRRGDRRGRRPGTGRRLRHRRRADRRLRHRARGVGRGRIGPSHDAPPGALTSANHSGSGDFGAVGSVGVPVAVVVAAGAVPAVLPPVVPPAQRGTVVGPRLHHRVPPIRRNDLLGNARTATQHPGQIHRFDCNRTASRAAPVNRRRLRPMSITTPAESNTTRRT